MMIRPLKDYFRREGAKFEAIYHRLTENGAVCAWSGVPALLLIELAGDLSR